MKILTRKLWRALTGNEAPHPIYERIINAPMNPPPWYLTCAIIVGAPFLLLPAILFLSVTYSLRWAVSISSTIARERESGMFDLIALSPAGALGVCRAICKASLNRNQALGQIQTPVAWIIRLGFTLLALSSVGILTEYFVPPEAQGDLQFLIVVVYLVTFTAALMIDHVQSVVLACLIGMLTPGYTSGRVDAGAGAFMIFLLLTVITYLITLLGGFVAAPLIFQSLGVPSIAAALILPLIRLGILYGAREVMIVVIWRALVEKLNVGASEVATITG